MIHRPGVPGQPGHVRMGVIQPTDQSGQYQQRPRYVNPQGQPVMVQGQQQWRPAGQMAGQHPRGRIITNQHGQQQIVPVQQVSDEREFYGTILSKTGLGMYVLLGRFAPFT